MTTSLRTTAAIVFAAMLALAGCGERDNATTAPGATTTPPPATTTTPPPTGTGDTTGTTGGTSGTTGSAGTTMPPASDPASAPAR